LGLVGLVGIGAAAACWLFPEWPIRLLQGKKFLEAVPLVPLFAWAVLPLTLTNILVNNLLARGRFAIVPILVLIAGGYAFALTQYHGSAREIIRMLFVFAGIACAISALFTCFDRARNPGPIGHALDSA
jgi:hypothetical protein